MEVLTETKKISQGQGSNWKGIIDEEIIPLDLPLCPEGLPANGNALIISQPWLQRHRNNIITTTHRVTHMQVQTCLSSHSQTRSWSQTSTLMYQWWQLQFQKIYKQRNTAPKSIPQNFLLFLCTCSSYSMYMIICCFSKTNRWNETAHKSLSGPSPERSSYISW